MKKILFSDMDGTILENNKLITPKDREAFKELRKNNILVFNTGRNYEEAITCLQQNDVEYDYLVLNNGGHIVDNQGHDLYKRIIPGDIGKSIIAKILSYPQLWTSFYDGEQTLTHYEGKCYYYGLHEKQHDETRDYVSEYMEVDDFDIMATYQDDEGTEVILEIKKWIEDNYGDDVSATLNTHFLDITPTNCSKGLGIKKLIEILDEPLVSYGVGDSYNDITMFEAVDHSYTFNRVNDDIKKHATKHIDYVYEIVEEILNEGD